MKWQAEAKQIYDKQDAIILIMLNSHESGRQQISRKTSGKDMNNQFKKNYI